MSQVLNEYQIKVVEHIDGPCLVTSVPGSGKTFVLVERIANLIKQGVKPEHILCITFTNKAAKEMKERVCKKLGKTDLDFFIGTFHSLCARLLREFATHIGFQRNFTILDANDQNDLLLQVARINGLDISKPDGWFIASKINKYRDGLESEQWLKKELDDDDFFLIANKYFEQCQKTNSIDFGGLIYLTLKLLTENEDVRKQVQDRFNYLLVDETQDTNKAQFNVINILGGKFNNIMLIGDLNQSIYMFQNARIQNIKDFLETHQNCKYLTLSKNYRSTPQIIKVADKLIRKNSSHMGDVFETDNKNGEPVRCYPHKTQTDESDFIANKILELKHEEGWDFNDIAILYRVNKMSQPLEQSLSQKGIPYQVIGAFNFYSRKEIKDCLAMLKFLYNPKDGISFHRLTDLISGLGNVTVGKIENIAMEKNVGLIEATQILFDETTSGKIRNCCAKLIDIFQTDFDKKYPSQCLQLLLDRFNYSLYIDNSKLENKDERKENIKQMIESSGVFDGEENALEKYLQNVLLATDKDESEETDKIKMMSLHSSKGLEFPIVFIVGVERNILPHNLCIKDFGEEDGLEEERRLLYVGMTRAKKQLYITFCLSRKNFDFRQKRMRFSKCYPSDFLVECDLVKKDWLNGY